MAKDTPAELIFAPHGAVELVSEGDEVLWASDSDPDFKDDFPDEFLNADEHGEDVLDWLIDNSIITEAQADGVDFVEESLEDAETDNSGDDDTGHVVDGSVLDS